MKTINFKELMVETEIGVFKPKDLSDGIGNILFQGAPNLQMDELARRIFKSEGPVKIADEDFAQMMKLLHGVAFFRVYTAIENAAAYPVDNVQPVTESDE